MKQKVQQKVCNPYWNAKVGENNPQPGNAPPTDEKQSTAT
jgi:hypothetical protein